MEAQYALVLVRPWADRVLPALVDVVEHRPPDQVAWPPEQPLLLRA